MGTKYYKNNNDLREVDEVLAIAEKAIMTKGIVINDPSSAPKIIAASLTAVAGSGAAIAGLAGTSAIGTGIASGAIGATGLVGGVALAPIALPLALITGVGYLLFKNKKERELRERLQIRLKKAVEMQNKLIRQYQNLLQSLQIEAEKEVNYYKQIVKEQAKKIEELAAINTALQDVISKMSAQLS
ncbi:hypothetical protein [Bacillus sp. T3]|uniref:hypothetical protein n=1 Tax=Bacillus sp. T3 TaxID=467262 RepID=UPI00298293C1|nr:hypothetical protein [Bacillus sp. T3]